MATKAKKTGKAKKPAKAVKTKVSKAKTTAKRAVKGKTGRGAAAKKATPKKAAPAKKAKKTSAKATKTKATTRISRTKAVTKKSISKAKPAKSKGAKAPAKKAAKPVTKAQAKQPPKAPRASQTAKAQKPAPAKKGPTLKVIRGEETARQVGFEQVITPGYLVGLDIAPYQEKAGEEYMNDKQHDHFRKILQKWKEQLLEEMDRTVHHLQDEAINLPDPNDRASQEEEFSLELRARDRERKLIKKIEETLQKIDEDEYGFCDSCGVEIGIRRLEARPTANLCIDCKTLDEIRERQMGG